MRQTWNIYDPINIKEWEKKLKSGEWSINDENDLGETLLIWACRHANEGAVALCAQFSANPFIPDLQAHTPAMVWRGSFLESEQDSLNRDEDVFLKYFPQHPRINRNFWTLFGILDPSFIEAQFQRGLNPSNIYYSFDHESNYPLFEALPYIKDIKVVELLLKYGADPLYIDDRKLRLLDFALLSPCLEVWSWAVKLDNDLFRFNEYYNTTPLRNIFAHGIDMWNFLKPYKINWSQPCDRGLTPIMVAAKIANNTDWVNWLIDEGCDPLITLTPDSFFKMNQNSPFKWDRAEYDEGKNLIDFLSWEPREKNIKVELIKRLVDLGVSPFNKANFGKTPLDQFKYYSQERPDFLPIVEYLETLKR